MKDEQLRAALAAALIGTWDWDIASDEYSWDAAQHAIFGVDPGSFRVSREQIWGRTHPDDRQRLQELTAEALASGAGYQSEFRILRPDGSVRWCVGGASVQRDPGGRPLRMVGFTHDITAHKQREVELRSRNETLSALLSACPLAVMVLDLDGTVRLWNPAAEQLFGWSAAEVIGQILPAIAAEDRAAFLARINQIASGVTLSGFEAVRLRKGGSFHAEIWTAPVILGEGERQCLSVVADISARKQGEAALQESQHFLQRLTETVPNVIYVYDLAADRNVYANRQLAEALGYTPAEAGAMGVSFLPTVIHPEDWAATPAYIARLLALPDGEIVEREYRVRHRDGSLRWFYGREMIFARDEAGRPSQILGSIIDITERKRAEGALRESEIRYRTLFTSIDEGFCVIELIYADARPVDYRFIEVNPTFEQQTGLRNPVGKTMRELVPGIEDKWPEVYDTIARTGEAMRFADGSQAMGRWFDIYAFPFGDPGARRVAVLFTDITERKRREASAAFLAEVGELLVELAGSAAIMARAAERVGRHFGADRCTLVEFDLEAGTAAVPEEWRRHPGDAALAGVYRLADFVGESFGQALLSGAPIAVSEIGADPLTAALAERYRDLRIAAFLTVPYMQDEQLKAALVLCWHGPHEWRPDEAELLRELTARIWMRIDRVRADEALRQSEARFRLAEMAARGFNYDWDLLSGVVTRSESIRRVLGYRRDEIAPSWHAWAELLHPDDRLVSSLADAVAYVQSYPDEIMSSEYRIRHGDGHYVWVQERAMLLRDAQGRVRRVIGQTTDISERKAFEASRERLYAQEQAARAQAEEASRLKDEFLATVSHELRTPLTAFLGYAHLLSSRRRDEAYIARTVEKMLQSAKAQAQLIEDLLDVSRIVSGKLRLEMRPLDLAAVVQAAIDTVRPTAEARALQLHASLGPGGASVVGDAGRLQQVVWNLLTNAAKFTPPGGMISVQLDAADGEARLTVSDTGKGISPSFLPYVFDQFRQADSTSQRSHGGLGLGLAIVRHLVELHGGTVRAASAGEGQGASFSVRLPLAAPGVAALPAPAAGAAGLSEGYPAELRGLRVLLVDDQPEILDLLHEVIAPAGAELRLCTGARAALELIRSWRPDVLISDIAMPEADGYWLIQQIRALPAEEGGGIPAAALTAYVRVEERMRVLSEGYQLYLPKPVEPDELLDVLVRLAQARALP